MAAGAPAPDGGGLLLEVAQVVASIAPVPLPYTGEEHLYHQLGLESVQVLSLLLTLEERFGVSLDDQRFVQCRTVSSLAKLVHEAQRAGVAT